MSVITYVLISAWMALNFWVGIFFIKNRKDNDILTILQAIAGVTLCPLFYTSVIWKYLGYSFKNPEFTHIMYAASICSIIGALFWLARYGLKVKQ